VLETNTFQSTRMRLHEWGLAEHTREQNLQAAGIARRVADTFQALDGRRRFVAGSMGPTGMLPSSDDPALSNITWDELSDTFYEQAKFLVEGGVDVLLIETSVDILEVKAAIDGIRRALEEMNRPDVAVQAQVFLDLSGRMLLGTDIQAMMTTLESLSIIDVIGLNCSTGPEHMREAITFLCNNSRLPISCIPNAGLPLEVDGETVFPLEPDGFAKSLSEFVQDLGVSVVGGCCGTTPEHLKKLVEAIGNQHPPKVRDVPAVQQASSAMRAMALVQNPGPFIIGERVNSTGSRKVKRLLLNDDYDAVLQIAREQADSGAHAIDVQVAMTERGDEKEQMQKLLKKLTMGVELPLVIDSTEAEVLEAAMQMYPGRAIINSTSLEGGRAQKFDKTMPLVARYGAAIIGLTIDDVGMAHTAQRKLEIAQLMVKLGQEDYGVQPDAWMFDTLTFPITTGQAELRNSARETLDGIGLVKQHIPGALTVLGVSNLSFGIQPHARAALNSVFLYHAVKAGLDAAIINPAHVMPFAEIPAEVRKLCEDVIFNTDDEALPRMIQYFEQTTVDASEAKADPTAGMSPEERIHWKILHRKKDGIETDIDEARATREDNGMARGIAAVDVLNGVMLPAMKEVGDKFGAGELILPYVLQSAEVMKRAVSYLEQYLDRLEGSTKGKVVLATVYGDVHDIGKNLVNTILSNNGYTVYDLGKQVPLNTIIEKAIEVGADAIGLSALLVSTSKQMPLCVQELHKRNLSFPVLIGGAAINRQYGQRITFPEPNIAYGGGVFYCKDAFEGLDTMDRLSDPTVREEFMSQMEEAARASLNAPERGRTVLEKLGKQGGERSNVSLTNPVPTPPFWGAQVAKKIRLDDVSPYLDLNTLWRLAWGIKNLKGAEYDRLISQEFMPRLKKMQAEAKLTGWLQPQAVYGYFPCQADGEELVVYDPKDRKTTLTRFVFPRQPARDRLCLADYFRPVSSGEFDVVGLQIVTMGHSAAENVEQLQQSGDYSESYFRHGLSTTYAEALAEYTNKIISQGLGLSHQAKRYSWGYPACPDVEEHAKLFAVLPAQEIGVNLTTGFQLDPEQSTAAIVVHHPEAKYFSIGSGTERAEADLAELVG
jgi:5-methyltetrahydrofolate--homocysteine methyltransferase